MLTRRSVARSFSSIRRSVYVMIFVVFVASNGSAYAASQFPAQHGSGSVGLEGTISSAPPSQAATISSPSNGSVVTSVPVVVSGLCPSGLLVKVFTNNIFVGSVQCTSGSYSVQVDLFGGQNDLVSRVFDALNQAGPDSNIVTMTFNDAQLAQFGSHVFLTSNYAKRGADPGSELDWPVVISGGTGPYALSIDWGDNSPTDLMSESFAGQVVLKHTYKTAGTYSVIIKVTDKNGTTAYLQVVAVANGAIQSNQTGGPGSSSSIVRVEVYWWPALVMAPLIVAAFWVGRRHELYTLRKQLEKSRKNA